MVVTIGLISMKRILVRWEMVRGGTRQPALANQTRHFTEFGGANQPVAPRKPGLFFGRVRLAGSQDQAGSM